MTLDDLAQFLPNGFQDAGLVRLDINYEARKTVMFLNVDCSDAANKLDASYRPVSITFSEVQFVVVDPPNVQDTLAVSTIDVGSGQPRTAPLAMPALWRRRSPDDRDQAGGPLDECSRNENVRRGDKPVTPRSRQQSGQK